MFSIFVEAYDEYKQIFFLNIVSLYLELLKLSFLSSCKNVCEVKNFKCVSYFTIFEEK